MEIIIAREGSQISLQMRSFSLELVVSPKVVVKTRFVIGFVFCLVALGPVACCSETKFTTNCKKLLVKTETSYTAKIIHKLSPLTAGTTELLCGPDDSVTRRRLGLKSNRAAVENGSYFNKRLRYTLIRHLCFVSKIN